MLAMRFIFTLIIATLLAACTDYVQKMDDGFDEWEQAQTQITTSSSSQTETSSSSVKSKNSSSSVILSGDSREKSSSSTKKNVSSSSNKNTSSSSTKLSSSNKASSSSGQKINSSSSVKTISSSSKATSSSSTKSSSSSAKAVSSSSNKKNEVSSSSVNPKISSSGKASWAYLNPAISYGEIIDDRDGQVYKTVKIGEQTWMAENLNYKVENSYCYNDSAKYCEKYGRLYTWAAAMDSVGLRSSNGKGCGYNKPCSPTYPVQGVCPDHWHLPAKSEFFVLISTIEENTVAGKALKSKNGWKDSGNGSDAYGFSAIPAGSRDYNGGFLNEPIYEALFWSSTQDNGYSSEDNRHYAYHLGLNYSNNVARLETITKRSSFSIRCIKDENETQKSSSSTSLSSSSKESWAYLNPAISYGEMTDDRDGQVYKTVKIGNQTWMAENLNFEIENSYCYDDSSKYCSIYGRYYTWALAMDSAGTWSTNSKGCNSEVACTPTYPVRGICPKSWHLPTMEEFQTLVSAGSWMDIGKQLKSLSGWGDINGTDVFGFSAHPTGYVDSGGNSGYKSSFIILWSSSEIYGNQAYHMNLYDNDNEAHLDHSKKVYAYPIRCVKD